MVQGQRIHAIFKWMHKGCIITKCFFSIAKLKPSKKMIYAFKNGNGVVVSWKDELKDVCCKFYNKLYELERIFVEK